MPFDPQADESLPIESGMNYLRVWSAAAMLPQRKHGLRTPQRTTMTNIRFAFCAQTLCA